jgi:hypothetical protein
MTIVLALVEQIRGTLKILPGDNGRGTSSRYIFDYSGSGHTETMAL